MVLPDRTTRLVPSCKPFDDIWFVGEIVEVDEDDPLLLTWVIRGWDEEDMEHDELAKWVVKEKSEKRNGAKVDWSSWRVQRADGDDEVLAGGTHSCCCGGGGCGCGDGGGRGRGGGCGGGGDQR